MSFCSNERAFRKSFLGNPWEISSRSVLFPEEIAESSSPTGGALLEDGCWRALQQPSFVRRLSPYLQACQKVGETPVSARHGPRSSSIVQIPADGVAHSQTGSVLGGKAIGKWRGSLKPEQCLIAHPRRYVEHTGQSTVEIDYLAGEPRRTIGHEERREFSYFFRRSGPLQRRA